MSTQLKEGTAVPYSHRPLSEAGRRAISEAAKKRWAEIRAAGGASNLGGKKAKPMKKFVRPDRPMREWTLEEKRSFWREQSRLRRIAVAKAREKMNRTGLEHAPEKKGKETHVPLAAIGDRPVRVKRAYIRKSTNGVGPLQAAQESIRKVRALLAAAVVELQKLGG